MDAQLSGDAPGRTGETQQKGGENPVWQWSLSPMQQGISEVVASPLAPMASVVCAPRAVLVGAPLSNVVALAARTLQRTIVPPQQTDVHVALCGVEAVVSMGERRHI
jgi:hypothetical protein